MRQSFSLPVSKSERIRVVYKKPDPPKRHAEEEDDAEEAEKKDLLKRVINREKEAKAAPNPLIIMMHGFPGGHMAGCESLYPSMEKELLELGYPCVRFDFRGCGESDGLEEEFCIDSALEDLNAVLQWAEHDAGHRSAILMGESFGATIAILGFRPGLVKALILLWPAIVLKETDFKALFEQEEQEKALKRDMDYVMFAGHRIGSHCVNDIYTTDLTTALAKINVPTLIQHGTKDEEVPLEQAYVARDNLKGLVDIGVFEGGGHGLKAPNMRRHLFVNIRYFLGRVAKKLDLGAKNT